MNISRSLSSFWVALAILLSFLTDAFAAGPSFVSIEATWAKTSEPLAAALIAPGKFTVRRRDSLDVPLTIYLAYGGTATAQDYEALPDKIVVPAGGASAEILILAKADDLLEGTETVIAKIAQPPNGEPSYEISPIAGSAEVSIADEDVDGSLPLVGIKIVRGETIEPSPFTRVAPGEFVIYREGTTRPELNVIIAVEGSATPGLDYEPLEKVVHFASGEAEVRVLVGAYDDSLIEGDETVALQLVVPAIAGLPAYSIIPTASAAKLVIHDNDDASNAVIKIVLPEPGAVLPAGKDVEVRAVAVDPEGYISTLEFYLDGNLLDTSVITFIRAPDPGTPIEHSVIWKAPSPGKHELLARGKDSRGMIVSSEPVTVIVAESSDTLVSIVAIDPQGTELPPALSSIDPLEFEISRTGQTAGALVVFISLHGTASPGDYFDVPTSVIIPSGSPSVKLQIVPKPDVLTVVEPMETVGVRLEPSPVAGPLRTYGIDPARASAVGVIYEQRPPEKPTVELAFPDRGQGYELGQPIQLLAASYAPAGSLVIDFYDGDRKIGSVATAIKEGENPSLSFDSFLWMRPPVGEHIVTARAAMADGSQIVSSSVLVVVKDSGVSQAYIKITEPGDGQVFPVEASIPITAVAVDPEGYIPRVEFFANDERIGVSELAFFRESDPGTPITHNFVWEKVPAGDYVLSVRGVDAHARTVISFPIKITVGPGGDGDRVVLAVEAVDPFAAETTAEMIPDNAVFAIRRIAGPKNVDVPVRFALYGSAVNRVDYSEVKESTIIPAGSDRVEIVIQPISDKAIESDEVIELGLKEPACIEIFPAPPECYVIGNPASAKAVLRDDRGPNPDPSARIEIVSPKSGETFEAGSDIPVVALAIDPKGYISRVEFYANERLIGVSEIVFIRAPDPGTPITHTVLWTQVPAGDYVLTARGMNAQGELVSSFPVKIIVGGTGGGVKQVILSVEAIDAFAAETTDTADPDTARFLIRRIAGPKDIEVPVVFKLAGTAINGVDYSELKEQIILPAGSETIEVIIKPIADGAAEPEETVELLLVSPVCPAIYPPPPQCYLIGKAGAAQAVIRDHSTGKEDWQPKVAIFPPSDGSKLERGKPLEIRADVAVQGKPCILETSTDLKTWEPLAPVFLPDGQLTYITEAGTDSRRYYRLNVK